MQKVICPVCWHKETLRANKQGEEPCRDDTRMMVWHPPIPTIWDDGYWCCEYCYITLHPSKAAILNDAVLRVSDPDSDSYDGETFKDAYVATEGDK